MIQLLPNPGLHFKSLIISGESLSFATTTSPTITFAALPSTYQRAIAVRVNINYTDKDGNTVTLTERRAKLIYNPDDFWRLDSSNFIVTPTGKRPVILIADRIYGKPSPTTGYIDYVKSHPTIDASNGTKFDDVGDNLLVLLIVRRYYQFIEEEGLVGTVNQEIGVFSGNK